MNETRTAPLSRWLLKFQNITDLPVYNLPGEGKHTTCDNDTVKHIVEIQVLDGKEKFVLFNLIDT